MSSSGRRATNRQSRKARLSKGEFNSVAQANGGLENMINWEGKDKDLLALIKYIAEEDKLKLDPTFLKETFCFLCIIALLCPKNLYVQISSPYPSPYVSFFRRIL